MSDNPSPHVSIIIRTKNEERWIATVLRSVYSQNYKDFEVILVDNMSTDRTVAKALQFPVRVIGITEYRPGNAINVGIKSSLGQVIVLISGHCIPTNEHWLENLICDLSVPGVAGVYGRQEPMAFSSPQDKRDLINTFGLDKIIQKKDSFFHNANSAFLRSVWERFPFDDQASNIEDRLWGREVISNGYQIVYEPNASVFHWHGIHQNQCESRMSGVVRILEQCDEFNTSANHIDPKTLRIVAMIPSRGPSLNFRCSSLLSRAISSVQKSLFIDRVLVIAESGFTRSLAVDDSRVEIIERPDSLDGDHIDTADILAFGLDYLERGSEQYLADLVVFVDETYPLRPANLLDDLILKLLEGGHDTVVAARSEKRGIYLSETEGLRKIGDGFMPRAFKNSVAFVGMVGMGCVTHPLNIRSREIFEGKIGFYSINDPFVDIRAISDEIISKLEMIGDQS